MTTLKIDIRNMSTQTHPDDRVILYAPEVRARIGGGLVSTAPLEVELVDGQATVENVEPGPLVARFECRGVADTTEKRGIVPDSGIVTLDDVLELKFTWTPPVIASGLQQIIDEMNRAVGTVGGAVDGAMGGLVRSAESAARASAQSSAGSEVFANAANVRAASAETKVNAYTPRVDALEVMGGLAPGEPVDGQTANLIEQPETLTRGAVRTASVEVVHESAPVITVGPAGQFETQSSWDVSTGGDDYRAIQDAIDACPVGGTVHLDFRGRDTFSSETLHVTKPIKITSGTTTDRAGRIWFPMHKTGFVVQAPSSGGARPSNVVMENIYIRGPVPASYAPSDTEGVGIHVKDGRVHFRDVIVQFMSGHGLYIQAGRQHDHYGDGRDGKGGNVTKSQFDNFRVANVWGDGIKLHGTDTQACLFVKPDIAGCKGWGLNVDTANINQFIMPHFDQQSSEKGMIRDCANSNDYGFIYAETGTNPEIGGLILLDKDTERESVNAKFEVATYAGSVTIVDNTTSRSATFYDRRNRTFRRSLGVTSMDTNHSFQFDSGATSTSAFSLRYIPGPSSPYKEDPGNMTVLDHNLATDLTTFRRRVKMQDQLRLGVVNPPSVARPNPVNAGAGAMMFDASIGKIIVSNGAAWTDGAGNPL